MMSDLLELLKRWRVSMHMTFWHNALVPQTGRPCDVCTSES
jgi:hypothetical protein